MLDTDRDVASLKECVFHELAPASILYFYGTVLEIIENITEFNLIGAVFLAKVTG